MAILSVVPVQSDWATCAFSLDEFVAINDQLGLSNCTYGEELR